MQKDRDGEEEEEEEDEEEEEEDEEDIREKLPSLRHLRSSLKDQSEITAPEPLKNQ